MKENLGNLQESGIIERYRKFIFGISEDSDDIEAFLAPGKIEQLVRGGRTPLQIGTMGLFSLDSKEEVKMLPLYEVPPVGFAGQDMKDIYEEMGVHVFVNKLGVKRFGSTFMLNETQVDEVEGRIKTEKERLGKTSEVQK